MLKNFSRTPSLAFLLISNAIPVAGIFFLGWDMFTLMTLYWFESAIIGVFNVGKMLATGKLSSVFNVPFFVLHYGGFMAVHMVFLSLFFAPEAQRNFPGNTGFIIATLLSVWVGVAAMVISHGVSFVKNFIGQKEYQRLDKNLIMFAPYKRIIIMHLTILLGGMVSLVLGTSVGVLVLMAALKTVSDVYSHLKEHTAPEVSAGEIREGVNI